MDRNAQNSIESLSQTSEANRRNTMTRTMGGGGADAVQLFSAVAQERQAVVQVADGSHLQSIYVLERDSKFIYEYDISKKVVFRRQVNMQ